MRKKSETMETPHERQARLDEEKKQRMKKLFEQDMLFKTLSKHFEPTIQKITLTEPAILHPKLRKEMRPPRGTYFVIDIECNGPVPGLYDMVSLGASVCTTAMVEQWLVKVCIWKCALRHLASTAKPLPIHGLDQNRLHREGLPRAEACRRLAAWVKKTMRSTLTPYLSDTMPHLIGLLSIMLSLPRTFQIRSDTRLSIHVRWQWGSWERTGLKPAKKRFKVLKLTPEDKHTKHRADADAAYQAKILIALLNRISVQSRVEHDHRSVSAIDKSNP